MDERSRVVGGSLLVAGSLRSAGGNTGPFEVASVRSSDPSSRYVDFRVTAGGRLTVTRWQLSLLIQRSYGVKRHQIVGGPGWMDSDPYDIAAKATGNPTEREMMAMLRELLAERFWNASLARITAHSLAESNERV